ncbi:MAG: hypothetical protein QF435_14925 [Arenicellales bacterium]|jgi:hypothetical protein|nr:hypothetical protein [Arenicellales bacterium]
MGTATVAVILMISIHPNRPITDLRHTVPTIEGMELRQVFLDWAPETITYLQKHTAVQLMPVPVCPNYYPQVDGATTGGRVLEPRPFDGRQFRAAFRMLRPPLPEVTLFGGMMVARAELPHFRRLFRSARSSRLKKHR